MTSKALDLGRGRRINRGWSRAARLAVPVVVLGLLWNLADGPTALAMLGEVDWLFISLALVAVNLQTILSALRWRAVAARLGMHLPLRQAVAEYYLSQLINQSLPGGVVGDTARAVRGRHAGGLGKAAQAVIIERMAGQIAMFALLAVGLVVAIIVPGGLDFGGNGVAILVGIAIALALLPLAIGRLPFRWAASFSAAAKRSLLTERAWIGQIILGVTIVALNLSSFALCALATGTALDIEAILVLVPLILCAMLIPATVAGWGFREGAAAGLFPLAGATATAGFAASLAFGLVLLASSLPGLLVLLEKRKVTPSEHKDGDHHD